MARPDERRTAPAVWCVVAAVTSIVLWAIAPALLELIAPLVRGLVSVFLPDFSVQVLVTRDLPGGQAVVARVSLDHLILAEREILGPPLLADARVTVGGALLPVVIGAATAAAMSNGWRRRWGSAVVAVLLAVLVSIMLLSVELAGLVLDSIHQQFAASTPALGTAIQVIEGGGRVMAGLLAGLAAVGVMGVPRKAPSQAVGMGERRRRSRDSRRSPAVAARRGGP